MKQYLLLLAALVSISAAAQNRSTLDSMMNILATAVSDTALVNLYYKIGTEFDNTQPDSAAVYYLKAGSLSSKLNYNEGKYRFAINYSYYLNFKGMLDSSLAVNRRALNIARMQNSEEWIARVSLSTGSAYYYRHEYMNALKYYMETVPYFERTNNTERLSLVYDMIQNVYCLMQQPETGIEYGKKALTLLENSDDAYAKASVLINLSNNYTACSPPKYDEARKVLFEALQIAKDYEIPYYEAVAEGNIATIFLKSRDMDINEFNCI